jgi:signal transduction histidine kinase
MNAAAPQRRRRNRLTARTRLTITFISLFFLASLLLVGLNFVLLTRFTDGPPTAVSAERLRRLGVELPAEGIDQERITRALGSSPAEFFNRIRADYRTELLERLFWSSAIAVALAAGIAWVVGGRVAKRALAPVRDMTAVAQRLSADCLDERIGHDGPVDEISELADTFDDMLDRLQAALDAHRHFGAYVGHEMLTPLTAMRAEADLVADAPESNPDARALAAVTIRHIDQSSELLRSLLAISRAEAGLGTTVPVDIAEVVGDVTGEVSVAADALGLTVDLAFDGAAPSLLCRGDRPLITSLVHNLLRNALKYNVPAGRIDVALRSDGGDIVLAVTNSGLVLAEADIVEMSKPFRRLALQRVEGPGHGLGTAIVTAVARAHGGTATWTRRLEGGVKAEVRLPRSNS